MLNYISVFYNVTYFVFSDTNLLWALTASESRTFCPTILVFCFIHNQWPQSTEEGSKLEIAIFPSAIFNSVWISWKTQKS